jgi:hypothetical protein
MTVAYKLGLSYSTVSPSSDPGQTACGGGGTATLSFSPTSPGSFTIGGADLTVTLTGTPTGGAFTLGTTSTAVTGGSFSLTGSTLTYSGGTSAGTATAEVTYTVTGFTPVTATYSVTVTGGGGESNSVRIMAQVPMIPIRALSLMIAPQRQSPPLPLPEHTVLKACSQLLTEKAQMVFGS